LNLRQELRPLAHQRHAAPEQVTGRAPLGGRDVSLRDQAPAAQSSNRVEEGASIRLIALQPMPYGLRSFLAPASRRG
jgi:hypothetical protein